MEEMAEASVNQERSSEGTERGVKREKKPNNWACGASIKAKY